MSNKDIPEDQTPDEWFKKMNLDVAVAYRVSEMGDSTSLEKLEDIMYEYASWLSQVKAEAWDEGFNTGQLDNAHHRKHGWGVPSVRNPHRQGR